MKRKVINSNRKSGKEYRKKKKVIRLKREARKIYRSSRVFKNKPK